MPKARKESVKIFQVVSLGEELCVEDISHILKKAVTHNSKKPNVFFTVTECEIEKNDYTSN